MVQGGNDGRDHHPNAFTMWLAGGGVKPGMTLGETDELGFNAVEDKVHVHDLHATILHLLGFDHTKLTYRFQGRDFRLTDVHGERGEEAAGVSRRRADLQEAQPRLANFGLSKRDRLARFHRSNEDSSRCR